MPVYLDIIITLNILFDSLLLYMTAILLKQKIQVWRLGLGGMIGALLVLLPFTPLSNLAGQFPVKLGFSVLMVFASFGFKRFSSFFKTLMLFYFSTFMVGGTLTGVHYFIQFDQDLLVSAALGQTKGFGDPISWIFVMLGFPAAWHFSRNSTGKIEMAKIQFEELVTVRINILGVLLTVKGMVDSGNQVYDPLTRQPVMFLSVKNLMDELPEPVKKLAEEPDLIMKGGSIPKEIEGLVKLIPYKVMGHEHQLRMALKPELLEIDKGDRTYIADKALVSFTDQELSPDDQFQCIVHPKMLTGTPVLKASAG
ncbi:sigma-E processing peptidase SpoIIGA [Bacillus massilinigeriensis]|uniref:sigma-E processing peptidase SpoIIGA n=1 Tax=Bacillus mediterraneensis TaxID=1805474 RepID=UPI0008F807E2|nr:sigma-E processing peptidase SpoIIGA [Bacillus mediterraneensis]